MEVESSQFTDRNQENISDRDLDEFDFHNEVPYEGEIIGPRIRQINAQNDDDAFIAAHGIDIDE